MSRVVAVLKSDLSLGLALSGIQVHSCANHKEQLTVLRDVLDSRDVGMVIVDEEFMDDMDNLLRKELLQRTRPLVVPIPGRLEYKDMEEESRDDLIHRLIRQAVGYQLNIQF